MIRKPVSVKTILKKISIPVACLSIGIIITTTFLVAQADDEPSDRTPLGKYHKSRAAARTASGTARESTEKAAIGARLVEKGNRALRESGSPQTSLPQHNVMASDALYEYASTDHETARRLHETAAEDGAAAGVDIKEHSDAMTHHLKESARANSHLINNQAKRERSNSDSGGEVKRKGSDTTEIQ